MTGPADEQDRELQRGTSALRIARNIRNEIESGRLRHEEQLPSTRALADAWGTSVATINRAMSMLAREGLVLNRPRSSRLVNYPRPVKPEGRSRPRVFLIGGYPGSGKTEFGRICAKVTGFAILDKDTTTRPVVEAALESLGQSPHDRESDIYLRVIRPLEYEALMATVAENIECHNSVVVTAPFIRELNDATWCARLKASVTSQGADLVVLWMRCDADTMRYYLRHRGAARDTTKLNDWSEYLRSVDLNFRPAISYHMIDNSSGARPLQEQAAELLERVVRL